MIEARQHLHAADGRLSAIAQLEKFMKEGALEVTQMQPLFANNLWLLDAAWSEAQVEQTITRSLRERKEPKDLPEDDRRLDILGVATSGMLTIVELKRPQLTCAWEHLNQIEDYVSTYRAELAESDSVAHVTGRLIVGRLGTSGRVKEKIRRLRRDDIRVETYGDLHARSREYYNTVEKSLEHVAPEYYKRKRTPKS